MSGMSIVKVRLVRSSRNGVVAVEEPAILTFFPEPALFRFKRNPSRKRLLPFFDPPTFAQVERAGR